MAYLPNYESLYMFGGLTNNNVTVNDMWRYDITTNRWYKIKQRGKVPSPRCGHSLSAFNDKLFLFGGLKEVT